MCLATGGDDIMANAMCLATGGDDIMANTMCLATGGDDIMANTSTLYNIIQCSKTARGEPNKYWQNLSKPHPRS